VSAATTPEGSAPQRLENVAIPRSAVRILAASATNARLTPELPLVDHLAAEVHERLGGCSEQFSITELRHCALRTLVVDQLVARYLAEHPAALGVGAWSMLGTRAHRLNAERWVDLDAPDLAKLRRHLLPTRPGWTQVSACLCCSPWADAIRGAHDRQAIFVLDESVIPMKPAALVHFLDEVSRVAASGSELLVAFDRRAPLRPVVPLTRRSVAELVVRDAGGAEQLVRYPRLRFVDDDEYESDVGGALSGVNALARVPSATEPALAHLRLA